MPQVLPLRPDSAYFEFQTVLDDATYTFTFRWNERDAAWYFHLSTEDGDPIVAGIKLVVDFPLGARDKSVLKPRGQLIAIDGTGKSRDPGADDLGDRVQLLYYSASEVVGELDGLDG